MPTSEEYRRSAEKCKQLALESQDRFERDALLKMAAMWDRLANYKSDLENEE
jgi:hypothetical protein